jgi:hypothetical protein
MMKFITYLIGGSSQNIMWQNQIKNKYLWYNQFWVKYFMSIYLKDEENETKC